MADEGCGAGHHSLSHPRDGHHRGHGRSKIEDRGSRIEDRGSRIEDRGSRIEDRGSRIEWMMRFSMRDPLSSILDPRFSILATVAAPDYFYRAARMSRLGVRDRSGQDAPSSSVT